MKKTSTLLGFWNSATLPLYTRHPSGSVSHRPLQSNVSLFLQHLNKTPTVVAACLAYQLSLIFFRLLIGQSVIVILYPAVLYLCFRRNTRSLVQPVHGGSAQVGQVQVSPVQVGLAQVGRVQVSPAQISTVEFFGRSKQLSSLPHACNQPYPNYTPTPSGSAPQDTTLLGVILMTGFSSMSIV